MSTTCSAAILVSVYATPVGRTGWVSSTPSGKWSPKVTTDDRCTKRRAPASRAASSASLVPRTFTCQNRETSVGMPTRAAVWTTTSQPRAASCHGPGVATSPATIPAAGSASRSTPTTSNPSPRIRSASARPMNPAAPVISTRLTSRRYGW